MRIDDPTMNDNTTKSLRWLNKLAKILKQRRIDNGYIVSLLKSYVIFNNRMVWLIFPDMYYAYDIVKTLNLYYGLIFTYLALIF